MIHVAKYYVYAKQPNPIGTTVLLFTLAEAEYGGIRRWFNLVFRVERFGEQQSTQLAASFIIPEGHDWTVFQTGESSEWKMLPVNSEYFKFAEEAVEFVKMFTLPSQIAEMARQTFMNYLKHSFK